jgi:uncharacterized protein involved in response to NO
MKDGVSGIPRYRATALPPLFSQGFRPFFLGTALWAPLSLGLWLLQLAGWLDLPTAFDPIAWHAHEMIFGFAMAAMAGHLMTAIPNWTGRMPLQGAPLLLLFILWLLGRIAVATSAIVGALPAAIADLAFPVLLALAVVREIVKGRNWRNLPMLAALGLLLAANTAIHLATAGLIENDQVGLRGGIAIFAVLIALVGGRLIPSFTRNWLVRIGATGRPAPFGRLDRVAIALVAAGCAAWGMGLPGPITGPLLLAAALATIARLVRWRGVLATGEPLLCAMHLGHGWLGLGFALLGASEIWPSLPPTAGLHALTAGAISTSILAVMTRATIHLADRPTNAGRGPALMLALITLAAILRVLAPFLSALYLPLVATAGVAWILAFAAFIVLRAGPLSARR